MATFKHVNETDENGTSRPVRLEVTSASVVRTSKTLRWEARLPLAKIERMSNQKKMTGDTVTISTPDGDIIWKLRNGQSILDAIDYFRS